MNYWSTVGPCAEPSHGIFHGIPVSEVGGCNGLSFGRCSGKVERGGRECLPCQASLCVRIGMESGLCFTDEKIAFAQRDRPLTMSIWRKP